LPGEFYNPCGFEVSELGFLIAQDPNLMLDRKKYSGIRETGRFTVDIPDLKQSEQYFYAVYAVIEGQEVLSKSENFVTARDILFDFIIGVASEKNTIYRYNPEVNLGFWSPGTANWNIDVDQDNSDDLRFTTKMGFSPGGYNYKFAQLYPLNSQIEVLFDGQERFVKKKYDEKLGDDLHWKSSFAQIGSFCNVCSQSLYYWGSTDGYLIFRKYKSGVGYYYGWVKVKVDNNWVIRLSEWAIEKEPRR